MSAQDHDPDAQARAEYVARVRKQIEGHTREDLLTAFEAADKAYKQAVAAKAVTQQAYRAAQDVDLGASYALARAETERVRALELLLCSESCARADARDAAEAR